jgi:hypothetical protein
MQDTGIVNQVYSVPLLLFDPSPYMECNKAGIRSHLSTMCLPLLGSYSDYVPNECLDKVPENTVQLTTTTTCLLSPSEFRFLPFSLTCMWTELGLQVCKSGCRQMLTFLSSTYNLSLNLLSYRILCKSHRGDRCMCSNGDRLVPVGTWST